jgi:nucleotide-binding universal stress UspA family protein
MTTVPYEMTAGRSQMAPEERYQETADSRLFTPIPICHMMVPLSGAPCSERALPHAMAVAVATGASVSLLFVETPEGQSEGRALDTTALDPACYLAQMRSQFGLSVPQVETRIVRAATPARGYADAECSDAIDLVVIAAQPPTDAAARGIGGLASELIRYSRAPVLLIPSEALPPRESAHVLVPLDGSGQAEYALFPIIALAHASRCQYINEITLLMVCEDRQEMSAATSYLEGVRTSLGRLVAPMLRMHVEVVHDRAAGAIVKSVRGSATRRFDLLALTTHGEGGCGGKLFGRVADHVLSRTEVPTLVVNPQCH